MSSQTPSFVPTVVHNMDDVMRALRAIRKELDRCVPVYGTWTPVLQGSSTPGTQTYSVQSGIYRKTDRLIHFKFQLILTAKDAATAGNMSVSLPFTAANDVVESSVAFGKYRAVNFNAGYTHLTGNIVVNTTRCDLFANGDNATEQNVAAADISATTRLYGSGWYVTAPGN